MSRRTRILVLSLVAALGLFWVFWATVANNSGVSNKLVSYNVVDSTLATVDLAVTKDPATTAKCSLEAMNDSYAVVGYKVITIGPGGANTPDGRTMPVRAQVRTDSLAVTGVVEDCWIVQQP
ncbi:DUF4307 domain-containing protein [Arthrobacter sp. STN4]|uniref:DUF4307 domain-containing protein n=1 Tax=Arthrobacter sp. STN4 TaxID=2923276 RepID=UPI00211A8D6A|nr:DUF4307 domain-containing protein [Arthrobacter sp. STN4]MCQ9163543.1 DUF4307 domain-containing protein [Arthrobacter sp. STN4]